MAFKKISNTEFEVQIKGRTKTILVPFGKTELIFKEFISAGGLIDPVTGTVQNDIVSLIASFRSVGNVLLTEFDEAGRVISEGNCFNLDTEELINLFLLASHIVELFIVSLAKMKPSTATKNQPGAGEGSQRKMKKVSQ